MRILITGGAGFLGSLLATTLLEQGSWRGARIDELVLADRVPSLERLRGTPSGPVREIVGDLGGSLGDVFADEIDVVFHLAAAVSGECEADFDLGMHANLDTTRAVLEAARAQQARTGRMVTVLATSSVAVFGSDPALPLPRVVTESTMPTPQSSYGVQKLVGELLVAEYTRKGFVDGRVARLMTVAVRPGAPNAAASSFLSGIIREPLAGLPAICPVDPDLEVAIASPRRTIEGILAVAAADRTDTGLVGRLPISLPALTVTVREMLDGLRRLGGDTAADLVTIEADPVVSGIVGSWPSRFDSPRARQLGLTPDASIDELIGQYIHDHPGALA